MSDNFYNPFKTISYLRHMLSRKSIEVWQHDVCCVTCGVSESLVGGLFDTGTQNTTLESQLKGQDSVSCENILVFNLQC